MNASLPTRRTVVALLGAMILTAFSQDYGKLCTLEMTAVGSKNPNQIVLSWPQRSDIKNYSLQRKAPGTQTLTVALTATAAGYTDTNNIQVGVAYDYKLLGYSNVAGNPSAYGDVTAGIEVGMVESRGGALLVIGSDLAGQLTAELDRFEADLTGEGWNVKRLVLTPADTVATTKAKIVEQAAAGAGLKSLILLGAVPVPYSGNINPDGHVEHKGAWPCDGYYGDLDGTWTDSTVNNTTAARPENHNVPGDGKFDQSFFPSAVELSVGRIDFSNLPAFSASPVELTRRYLNKNHAFRTAQTQVARRGIVDDNLSSMKEALAASSRRAICASFGSAGMVDADFLTHGENSLFGCGIGYGSYTSIEGVGTTGQLVAGQVRTVFNLHFGSYYGDWHSQDNVLRSVIAAQGVSLASMWSGRPAFQIYPMALGRTVGECVQGTMNQGTDAYLQMGYNLKSVHLALMGDPTLCLHTVAPVSNVAAVISGDTATVSWNASRDAGVVGYHVYRSDAAGLPFVRRNANWVTGTTFSDTAAPVTARYMVRAVKLETSASGSFFHGSTGVIAPATQAAATDPILAWKTRYFGAEAASPVAADDFDADGDGVRNLVEYACGTHPRDAKSKSGLTDVCLVQTAQGRRLCAQFAQCVDSRAVRVTIQCSTDLQSWTPVPPPTVASVSAAHTVYQVSVPAEGGRCFLRVLVQRI